MRVLVSVRNVDEAKIAFQAGVDLIDLKEPSQGAMGMVDPILIQQIKTTLPENLSLSMACGELCNVGIDFIPMLPREMFFYKFGLSQFLDTDSLVQKISELKELFEFLEFKALIVPVLYADFHRANTMAPLKALKVLNYLRFTNVMIDTWGKDGSSLLDWFSIAEMLEFQSECKSQKCNYSLAGSLDLSKVKFLISEGVNPAWFGFRGAICKNRTRNQAIDFEQTLNLVNGLKRLNSVEVS